ncbi:MAG: carboxypeptidase-like regulatory domain-containing protein, partial [Bacteroidales bacterium]|nr:carboxypeptidase-like regulatory domain-containing protein [Bacteroidales bacterium]
MKKSLLWMMLCLFCGLGYAQTVSNFIEENFNLSAPTGWPDKTLWKYDVFFYKYEWGVDGVGKPLAGNGVGNSDCALAWLHAGNNNGLGRIQTPLVRMGNSPFILFQYKIAVDLGGSARWATAGAATHRVRISKDNGATWETLEEQASPDFATMLDFHLVEIDASDYIGETCMVRLEIQANLGMLEKGEQLDVYLDEIMVGTEPENDLAVVAIGGNQLPYPDSTEIYTVELANMGSAIQNDGAYKVRLMQDGGSMLDEVDGVEIRKGTTQTVELEWTPTVSGMVRVYAEVVLDGDEFLDNNRSELFQIEVREASLKEIVVGRGTEKAHLPFSVAYQQSLAQTLYLPTEIGTNRAPIRSLVYKVNISTNEEALKNVPLEVWVGETDRTDMSGGWVAPESLTKVYDGAQNFPVGEYDVVVPFSTPYEYKGGNLVVYTHRKSKGSGSSAAGYDPADRVTIVNYFYGTNYPGFSRTIATETFSGGLLADSLHRLPAGGTRTWAPNTTFMIDMKDMGKVSGVVSDRNGVMRDVEVKIVGTEYMVKTNAQGYYEFPNVAAGTVSLEFKKYTYGTDTLKDIVVAADDELTENITMVLIPVYTLSGKITGDNSDGEGLEGVIVTLNGYANYTDTTDAEGNYSIPRVYSTFEYDFRARLTLGYSNHDVVFTMPGKAETYNVVLESKQFPVADISAIQEEDARAIINWKSPIGYEEKTYIMDDYDQWDHKGYAFEDGTTVSLGYPHRWVGSRFDVGTDGGEITSVEVYGASVDTLRTSSTRVTIEIFNKDRELIGESAPFDMRSNTWTSVPLIE